jgi:hypothetical protein
MAIESIVARARRLRRQRPRLLRGARHSLHVVGIASDPTERFLLRTLAAALLALVVPLWLAAARPSTSLRHGPVWGVVTYLVASSLVDLAAYMGGMVSGLSVPSAAVRIALAVLLVVLQRRGG